MIPERLGVGDGIRHLQSDGVLNPDTIYAGAFTSSAEAETLTEPSLGIGFGRGCEGASVDGAGREGVAAVNPVAETPQNGLRVRVDACLWLQLARNRKFESISLQQGA